jgi:hypothetical protein
MSKLRLNMACWDYDRTRALMDGRVQPEGIDLNYINLLPGRLFSECSGTMNSISPRCPCLLM